MTELHPYIISTVSSLTPSYRITIPLPAGPIAQRIAVKDALVHQRIRVFHEGETVAEEIRRYRFSDGETLEEPDQAFTFDPTALGWGDTPGYVECDLESDNRIPIFSDKSPIAFYSLYTANNRKTFLSDNALKYGAPPVIDQITRFGRYVDGYPVVRLDRNRGYGESLVLINPFQRPIVAGIRTHDDRRLKRRKVPPQSARRVDLTEILNEGEEQWTGRIQLTANNRLIVYTVKHAFEDSTRITDHEHIDPFRADPTHIPATQRVRQVIGDGLINRN